MKCRFTRFRISRRLDDGLPLPPRLERHPGNCPECAAWLRMQQSLIRQLRRTTPPSASLAGRADDSPVFSQAKILRALRQTPVQPRPQVFSWNWPLTATSAAAALVVMAAGTVFFTLKHSGQSPDSSRQSPLAETGTPSPSSGTAGIPPSHGAAATVNPRPGPLWKTALSLDQPLRRELALLNADALAAVRGLKSSILPGG
ncbi:MAG: hypothetical protein V4726_24070 [Verrucomicrobiota bacterium]